MRYLFFFLITLLLTSCGVKQLPTSSFVSMKNPSDLNGSYVNNNGTQYLSNVLFEDYRSSDDSRYRAVDMVNLSFPTKDSLIVSFTDATGYKIIKYKGEIKDNYFEYYIEKNRLYVPPFFMRHWVTKRRIGINKDGKLEVHKYYNNFGALFIIAGGASDANSAIFEPYSKDSKIELFSVNINDKWGYKDKNDSLVIAPQYDYAQLFEDGVAKVSLNGKWGCIDTLNQVVIPISYDVILPPQDSTLRVCKNLKWGLVDLHNNIIAPIEYNQIGRFGGEMHNNSLFNNLAKVYRNNKIGFINKKGEEIIPAIYDEVGSPYYGGKPYYRTKLGTKYGYVTGNGVFCEPIFDKADNFRASYEKELDLFAKVSFEGQKYLLTTDKMLYPYKAVLGVVVSVDFDKGFKIEEIE